MVVLGYILLTVGFIGCLYRQLRGLFGEDLKFPNGGRLGGVEDVQPHEAGLDRREAGREAGASFGTGIGHFPFFVRI